MLTSPEHRRAVTKTPINSVTFLKTLPQRKNYQKQNQKMRDQENICNSDHEECLSLLGKQLLHRFKKKDQLPKRKRREGEGQRGHGNGTGCDTQHWSDAHSNRGGRHFCAPGWRGVQRVSGCVGANRHPLPLTDRSVIPLPRGRNRQSCPSRSLACTRACAPADPRGGGLTLRTLAGVPKGLHASHTATRSAAAPGGTACVCLSAGGWCHGPGDSLAMADDPAVGEGAAAGAEWSLGFL